MNKSETTKEKRELQQEKEREKIDKLDERVLEEKARVKQERILSTPHLDNDEGSKERVRKMCINELLLLLFAGL